MADLQLLVVTTNAALLVWNIFLVFENEQCNSLWNSTHRIVPCHAWVVINTCWLSRFAIAPPSEKKSNRILGYFADALYLFACSPHDQHDWATTLYWIGHLNCRENIILASHKFKSSFKLLNVLGCKSANFGLSLKRHSLPWPLISTQKYAHRIKILERSDYKGYGSMVVSHEVDWRKSDFGVETLSLHWYPLSTLCSRGLFG